MIITQEILVKHIMWTHWYNREVTFNTVYFRYWKRMGFYAFAWNRLKVFPFPVQVSTIWPPSMAKVISMPMSAAFATNLSPSLLMLKVCFLPSGPSISHGAPTLISWVNDFDSLEIKSCEFCKFMSDVLVWYFRRVIWRLRDIFLPAVGVSAGHFEPIGRASDNLSSQLGGLSPLQLVFGRVKSLEKRFATFGLGPFPFALERHFSQLVDFDQKLCLTGGLSTTPSFYTGALLKLQILRIAL